MVALGPLSRDVVGGPFLGIIVRRRRLRLPLDRIVSLLTVSARTEFTDLLQDVLEIRSLFRSGVPTMGDDAVEPER